MRGSVWWGARDMPRSGAAFQTLLSAGGGDTETQSGRGGDVSSPATRTSVLLEGGWQQLDH